MMALAQQRAQNIQRQLSSESSQNGAKSGAKDDANRGDGICSASPFGNEEIGNNSSTQGQAISTADSSEISEGDQ